ncbi:hypothetical protein PILCRDRAFT_450162 [Piloderma croceum F 1598]|uniref:Uncharacterized protein n=1 Tax=Piloderma croceum (strain F 1598) TaxID=765440 RepID=A0A0C3FWV9_PILCF|nr:hypothetical protein PILCRDRAFT_450162 [Piloderma croceum F 1598]
MWTCKFLGPLWHKSFLHQSLAELFRVQCRRRCVKSSNDGRNFFSFTHTCFREDGRTRRDMIHTANNSLSCLSRNLCVTWMPDIAHATWFDLVNLSAAYRVM